MALDFTTTDVVDYGSGTSVDDPFVNDGTLMAWVFPDAVPPLVAGSWARKGTGGLVWNATTTSFQCTIGRSTQSLSMTATFANAATYAATKWCAVAAIWDMAGANGDQRMFHGDLATPFAEVAAYSLQRVGSGTPTDVSGSSLIVGNNPLGALPFDGKIGFIALWNRRLSLTELIAQQLHPSVTDGCVLFSYLGIGNTTEADWSGNGNQGTVTGTTLFPNAPLLPWYGGFSGYRGSIISPKPWTYYAQQFQQAGR